MITGEKNEPYQFIFGYGSLICPDSRAITAPSVAHRGVSIPVLVQNDERAWNKRSKSGTTFLGIRFREGTECTGVLLEVTDDEIDATWALLERRRKEERWP